MACAVGALNAGVVCALMGVPPRVWIVRALLASVGYGSLAGIGRALSGVGGGGI